ncbi:DoxX family membrane protein [Flavobacterium microcysteis]|uniref:DoxX family membrane protein n=1 Tax=Flavobacterium microcysteis TaxID=2596891 RepID=A0A501QHK8_9FLAO|nr:DoxX family membrane protein [Flavobacterium microcysteis]TPD71924.1 DoxX family membrane protein [Flavobacterium microcysteis]
MNNTASILILVFLAVTFLQSGYDKVIDWQGNVGWLKGHFEKTFIKNSVPLSLMLILVLEIVAGILCVAGIIQMLMNKGTTFGFYGSVVSAVTLIFLLFGQRIAKDYDGARTIAIYFVPAVLGVFFMQ